MKNLFVLISLFVCQGVYAQNWSSLPKRNTVPSQGEIIYKDGSDYYRLPINLLPVRGGGGTGSGTSSTNVRYARDVTGLTGDGATNVATAITNFVNTSTTASKLQFEKGATYLVNSTVTLTPEDAELDFNGATIKSGGTLNTTDTWVLRFGRFQTKHNLSTSAAQFPVVRGQNFFTYANASQLTVGDMCLVQGPIYWDDGSSTSNQDMRWGWYGRIMRIEGNRVFMSIPAPGGINMDLGTPIPWTSVSVASYGTLKNLTIKNLTIDVSSKDTGGAILVDDYVNVRFENVRIVGPSVTGSSLEQGLEFNGANAVIDNIQIDGLDDVPRESATYPININGHNITVQNSTLFKGNSINSAARTINSQNINHYNNVVYVTGSGAAISYHGNSSGTIDMCTLHGGPNSNSVVNIGASNTTIRNTTIYKNSQGPAITIADQVQTGILIENVKAFTDITAAQAADNNSMARDVIALGGNVGRLGFGNITINNSYFEGIMQIFQETRNLTITNTTFQGKDTLATGIFVESTCDTLSNLYMNNVTWRSGMAGADSYNFFLKIEEPTTQFFGTIENCNIFYHPSNNTSATIAHQGVTGPMFWNNNKFYTNSTNIFGSTGTVYYLSGNIRRSTAGVWNPITHSSSALPAASAAVNGRVIDVQLASDNSIVPFAATRVDGTNWQFRRLDFVAL